MSNTPNDDSIGLLTILVMVAVIIATVWGLTLEPIQ